MDKFEIAGTIKHDPMRGFMADCFGLCVYAQQIKATTNRINYITHHMQRCKKPEDVVKLSIMLLANIAYVTNCIMSIKQITERIKNG